MNLRRFLVSSFLIIALIAFATANFSLRVVQMRQLDNLLSPSRYDKRIRPNAVNESDPMDKPIVIFFNLFVRDIQSVDIDSKTMKLQINLRYEWTDARLKYDDLGGKISYMQIDNTSRIWMPDIFFPNELSATKHSLVTDNSLTRIYPDGRIYHSSRFSLTLICHMKLSRYPLDKQVCSLKIAPWGLTEKEVLFAFGIQEFKGQPIIITRRTNSLANYALIGTETGNCSSAFLHGRYTCIEVFFTFQRSLYQPITRIFTPTTFLLILSWIPFFLRGSPDVSSSSKSSTTPGGVNSNQSRGQIQTRLASFILSISSLLALVLMNVSISSNGPRSLDTINAGDIWTGVCLTLSFLSFLNVCIIEILERRHGPLSTGSVPWSEPWTREGSGRRKSLNHVHFGKSPEIVTIEKEAEDGKKEKEKKPEVEMTKKSPVVDSSDEEKGLVSMKAIQEYIVSNQVRCAVILGQILHPCVFLLFNIIYWTCLTRSGIVAPPTS